MKARKERVADIHQELVSQYGFWPCMSNVAEYLGVDARKARLMMDGLPAIREGRRTKLRAKAVAERLADMEARG